MNEIKLLNAKYAIIKCIVLLLLDDEFEIRQKTSSIISELVGTTQIFMGSYAQEVFLYHLLSESLFAIDKEKVIAMIILLMFEENEEEDEDEIERKKLCTETNITSEIQVFEKNYESFKERFAIKKLCAKVLKGETISHDQSDETISTISCVCNEIQSSVNLSKISAFIYKTL